MKKYITYENLKITSSARIYKTTYLNGSYVLLFGKRKLLQVLKFPEISASLF